MNWIIGDKEATCEFAGHAFIANRNGAIIMRDGIVIHEMGGFNRAIEAMVYCQKWAGVE